MPEFRYSHIYFFSDLIQRFKHLLVSVRPDTHLQLGNKATANAPSSLKHLAGYSNFSLIFSPVIPSDPKVSTAAGDIDYSSNISISFLKALLLPSFEICNTVSLKVECRLVPPYPTAC